MIFLCFNVKNRNTIVEKILNHMLSFGFDIWYDRKDIFLGDNRFECNIKNGCNSFNIKYAIIIITPEFSSGKYCKKELEYLWQRKLKNEIFIFPIFYNYTLANIPKQYSCLLDYVCKFIMPKDESIFVVYHIVSKITNDFVKKFPLNSINQYDSKIENIFLKSAIKSYLSIDRNNYNAKMTTLYLIYTYIKNENDFSAIPNYYHLGFEKLFSYTKLNIETDLRELQILENLTILLLNKFYV